MPAYYTIGSADGRVVYKYLGNSCQTVKIKVRVGKGASYRFYVKTIQGSMKFSRGSFGRVH